MEPKLGLLADRKEAEVKFVRVPQKQNGVLLDLAGQIFIVDRPLDAGKGRDFAHGIKLHVNEAI